MSRPIKGDEAVDEMAIEQNSAACLYLMDNVQQLSKDTLTVIITKLEATNARLKTVLEWRVKQSIGGEYVAEINEKLDDVIKRISEIESVFKEAKEATFISSQGDESPPKQEAEVVVEKESA